jgi:site-specific recombinase XerD
VVRLVVRVTEKGERERILPVPREAEMLLRVYLDHEGLKGYDRAIEVDGKTDAVLFVNGRNTSVSAHEYRGDAVRLSRGAVWKLIQTHGQAVGVPLEELHPHAIRHLFGIELAEDGVDLILRQALLGHADPKSTAIYDDMTIRRKVKTMDGSGPLGKIKSPVSELLRRL